MTGQIDNTSTTGGTRRAYMHDRAGFDHAGLRPIVCTFAVTASYATVDSFRVRRTDAEDVSR